MVITPNVTAAIPSIDQIPPGRLADKIKSLPAAAQERALDWLERFEIPVEDYSSIEVDPEGGIFYLDQPIAENGAPNKDNDTDPAIDYGITASEAFSLHSNPGAPNVIFLDFDGHRVSGTVWNSAGDYDALPFDRDGSPYSFSASELNDIANIWHRVAEDYKPFNVDVTTEDPGNFNANTGRILVTKKTDAKGKAMPYNSYGGVAYVGVWGGSNYTYYQPALVYYDNLGGGAPQYVAESATHEMGHNAGLSHDGSSSESYYSGSGSGYIKWAPIMGNSHNSQVSQWSKGEYSGANNKQDDMAILTSSFGAIRDDHGNTIAGATVIVADASGQVNATNPESDPGNYYQENKGVIQSASDVDFFQFESGAGSLSLQITPAWKAYRMDSYRGSDLDVEVSLYDSLGRRLTTANPAGDTYAAIQTSISAGTYYLSVKGSGSSNYSNYASIGQYFIDGYIPPATTAPTNQKPIALNDEAVVFESGSVTVDVLANDTDLDGDKLSIADFRMASNGTVSLNSDQTFTYVPNANFVGVDHVDYWATDGKVNSSMATLTITVETQLTNQRPVAVNDAVALVENSSKKIIALSNDYDPDEDPISVANYRQAINGKVTLNSDQTFTYVPNTNFFGTDKIDYWVTDGALNSSMATIAITVNEETNTNQRPVANNDATSVAANGSVVIAVLANDTDSDGDDLLIANFRAANYGTIKLNSDQTLTYTPNTNYSGSDSFDYWATDGLLSSNMATVTIAVNAPQSANEAPVAVNDAVSLLENASLKIYPLANDSDPDGDAISIADFRSANYGTVTLNGDQSLTYVPNANFFGTDKIDYWITDGQLNSSMATISVKVEEVVSNQRPVAVDDIVSTAKGSAVVLDILANDTDPEGASLLIANFKASNSIGTIKLNSNQTLTYTPKPNFAGIASFTYWATDGSLSSNMATVTINVGVGMASNQKPVAVNDSVSLPENSSLKINALANDSDPDGDNLTVADFRPANYGTVTLNSDQTFTYVPNANFFGSDKIDYWITDGKENSSMATISITVNEVATNQRPVAVDDNVSVATNSSVVIHILGNDYDPEGASLWVANFKAAGHGTIKLNQDQTLTYTPATNYSGTDSFTYWANDGGLSSNMATVYLTIGTQTANQRPVAVNDVATVEMNGSVVIDVLANDIDPDGDTLSVADVRPAKNGVATLNANNTITYVPNANFIGTEKIDYWITDGAWVSSMASVYVTVGVSGSQSVVLETPSDFVVNVAATTVYLSWSVVSDTQEYTIEREAAMDEDGSQWGAVSAISLGKDLNSFAEVVLEGLYRYRIKASNVAGSSAWSEWIVVSAEM